MKPHVQGYPTTWVDRDAAGRVVRRLPTAHRSDDIDVSDHPDLDLQWNEHYGCTTPEQPAAEGVKYEPSCERCLTGALAGVLLDPDPWARKWCMWETDENGDVVEVEHDAWTAAVALMEELDDNDPLRIVVEREIARRTLESS